MSSALAKLCFIAKTNETTKEYVDDPLDALMSITRKLHNPSEGWSALPETIATLYDLVGERMHFRWSHGGHIVRTEEK